MIGNFEPKKADLILAENQLNFSDLTGICSLLFCDKDTSLTLANAATLSNWVNLVASGDMHPVHKISDVQDESEEPTYQESKNGFRYKVKEGKYRFAMLVNVDEEFYPELKKLEGQNLKAYFADRNGNMIGVKDSLNFKPFTLDKIWIRKIGWGVYATSYVGITVEIALQSEVEAMHRFTTDFHAVEIRNESIEFSTVVEKNMSDWESIYGYLYNHFAVTDVRGIANGDFDVPTDAEWTWLDDYITAEIAALRLPDVGVGSILKSERTAVGDPPVGISTNEQPRWNYHDTNYGRDSIGFGALGGGFRKFNDGIFLDVGVSGGWWSSTEFLGTLAWRRNMNHITGNVNRNSLNKRYGFSVRLIRPATPAEKAALADGDFAGKYTGNDGKEYGTIYIGKEHVSDDGYVIMSSNLAETKFADLSDIPNVTDNTDWANLETAGRCAYDNLETNVGTGGAYKGLEFTITDKCNKGVEGILATDLTITDGIAGALTIDEFHDLGNGVYFLNTVEVYYYGIIELASAKYNGKVSYEISTPQYNPEQYNNTQYKIS